MNSEILYKDVYGIIIDNASVSPNISLVSKDWNELQKQKMEKATIKIQRFYRNNRAPQIDDPNIVPGFMKKKDLIRMYVTQYPLEHVHELVILAFEKLYGVGYDTTPSITDTAIFYNYTKKYGIMDFLKNDEKFDLKFLRYMLNQLTRDDILYLGW